MDASSEAFQRQKLVRHENLLWLIVSQGFVILPLLLKLPLWLWLVWFGALIWRLRIYVGKANYPSSALKFFLSLLTITGLISTYWAAFGVQAVVGFLVLAFILKLLELRSRKDALLLLFIGFVAVAAQFLFVQTIGSALYAAVSCVVLISAWQTIYLTRQFPVLTKLKNGTLLLLQAIPLMVVMFVLLPRLGALWQNPLLAGTAHTGFSDTLAPGDIGKLVQSKGTAFRVNFPGSKVPAQAQMYWRGLVLDNFDGRTWRLNKNWSRSRLSRSINTEDKELLQYEIIVEPHHYRWLFALAEPVSFTSGYPRSGITADGLLVTEKPLISRLQYRVSTVSPLIFHWPELSRQQRKYLTALPKGYNPKSVELAQRWLGSPKEIINQALSLFSQSFHYTLQPPLLGKNSVDEFLFSSKRGFCEHFASSLAVLMRAAGIPARVAVGYLGGSYNELEDYWLVRQADAHAWVEVWLEGVGWQRVDPTSVVAPQRVEQGIDNAIDDRERNMVAGGQFGAPSWLTRLRYRLDAANYLWSRWVLSYNADKQQRLFKQVFGGVEPWRLGVVALTIILFFLVIYTLLVIRPKWQTQTPLQKALNKFDKTCQQWEITRAPEETLALFVMRLAEKQPQLKSSCKQLAELSQRALYAGDEQSDAVLIRALRQFPRDVL